MLVFPSRQKKKKSVNHSLSNDYTPYDNPITDYPKYAWIGSSRFWSWQLHHDTRYSFFVAEILEAYAKLDSRFKVIHQENRGHSGARNTGLKHLSGEWMTWIGADDAKTH